MKDESIHRLLMVVSRFTPDQEDFAAKYFGDVTSANRAIRERTGRLLLESAVVVGWVQSFGCEPVYYRTLPLGDQFYDRLNKKYGEVSLEKVKVSTRKPRAEKVSKTVDKGSRIFEVKSCSQCPYLKWEVVRDENMYRCPRARVFVTNLSRVHKDCPLAVVPERLRAKTKSSYSNNPLDRVSCVNAMVQGGNADKVLRNMEKAVKFGFRYGSTATDWTNPTHGLEGR